MLLLLQSNEPSRRMQKRCSNSDTDRISPANAGLVPPFCGSLCRPLGRGKMAVGLQAVSGGLPCPCGVLYCSSRGQHVTIRLPGPLPSRHLPGAPPYTLNSPAKPQSAFFFSGCYFLSRLARGLWSFAMSIQHCARSDMFLSC